VPSKASFDKQSNSAVEATILVANWRIMSGGVSFEGANRN